MRLSRILHLKSYLPLPTLGQVCAENMADVPSLHLDLVTVSHEGLLGIGHSTLQGESYLPELVPVLI